MNYSWDKASDVEQLVWQSRLADLPRGENRAIIQRLFNGEPPFSEEDAEANAIQINRNDLSGVNLLSQARRQWLGAFLPSGNFFSVSYDSGPSHKRKEWSHAVTRHANALLHRNRNYIEQIRASGGTALLQGVGPSIWRTRREVVPRPIPISSLMVPSETTIDFDNLAYFAVFQEFTPAQLYALTHGPKRDPGWDMQMVQSQWQYVREQVLKQPNSTAFQYMPERIDELFKEDLGFWGSDAVPTIDVWDCYLRAQDDDDGWVRRIILDWNIGAGSESYSSKVPPPRKDGGTGFLYSSGKKKFANSVNEILHCNFADCSAVFPQMYHSVRSLGWMLWGTADLMNRLHCRFSENVFSNLLWWFRVASNNDLVRLNKAEFMHMGVIPQGVEWLKASDRFQPDPNLIQMGFSRFKQLMAENAASFTQDFDQGRQKEMTATETMARVNSVNALVSGMLQLAYTYQEFQDREVVRRLCIKGNPDPLAQKFRVLCAQDHVPPQMLDIDRMNIVRERTLGAGNKTLEMAIVQFLQQIRKNVGPDGQRRIDHIAIETATDDANLAQEISPLEDDKKVSNSMHDAELSTDRLMRGLPYEQPADAVFEDYIKVWLHDLTLLVQEDVANGNMSTPEKIAGYKNIQQHIEQFIGFMSENEEDADRVKEYKIALGQLGKLINGFEQRLMQQMVAAQRAQAKNGQGGIDGKTIGQIQAQKILAESKAKIGEARSAQRMAMDQAKFEQKQTQSEREHNAELRRMGLEHYFDQLANASKALSKPKEETEITIE